MQQQETFKKYGKNLQKLLTNAKLEKRPPVVIQKIELY